MGGKIKQVSGRLLQPYWILQSWVVKRKTDKGIKGSACLQLFQARARPDALSSIPGPQCSARQLGDDKKWRSESPGAASHRTVGIVTSGGILKLWGFGKGSLPWPPWALPGAAQQG